MTIFVYECEEAPPKRRFIAQHEKLEGSLYLTCHGSTAEIARQKAQLMLDYAALDPKDRTGFGLKAKLDAINEGTETPQPTSRHRRDIEDLA